MGTEEVHLFKVSPLRELRSLESNKFVIGHVHDKIHTRGELTAHNSTRFHP